MEVSDELLTQLAADSGPPGRAAASPADVVTPGSVLTLTGLAAPLSEMTPRALCPHKPHTHTHYTASVHMRAHIKYHSALPKMKCSYMS